MEARQAAEEMHNDGLANHEALYNSHQSLHAEHRVLQASHQALMDSVQQQAAIGNQFQAERDSTLKELQAVKQQAQQDNQHASSLLQSFAQQQEDATAKVAELQHQLVNASSVKTQQEAMQLQHREKWRDARSCR